jgi:hypothetical protein
MQQTNAWLFFVQKNPDDGRQGLILTNYKPKL